MWWWRPTLTDDCAAVRYGHAFVATGITLWKPLRNHGPTTLVMLALVAAGFVVLGRAGPARQQAETGPVAASVNAA